MMFARPVAMNQFDLLGIGFVEGSIVGDQEASEAVDKRFSFAAGRVAW